MTTTDLSQCKNCIYHYTYNGKDMCKQVGDDFYLQWKVEDCSYHTTITSATKISDEIYCLRAENAALREQISKMIMPPCTLGDTLYIISFCFGDGYDNAGNAVHTSGWQITETKVDEKNFYRMCDLVRNKKAFFSRESAEARLAELKGEEKNG